MFLLSLSECLRCGQGVCPIYCISVPLLRLTGTVTLQLIPDQMSMCTLTLP